LPYARTWSEELVAEWLEMNGYSVVIGLPVKVSKRGGRRDVDIVGFRVENGVIRIIHVEVGSFAVGPDKVVASLKKKFGEDVKNAVKKYVMERVGRELPIEYEEAVVGTWISEKAIQRIRHEFPGVKVWHFRDFIKNEIMPLLEQRVRAFHMFPDGHWLLNFLWLLKYYKII